MKRQAFRLESVLKIRRMEERTAALESVAATNKALEAVAVAEERDRLVTHATVPGSTDAHGFVASMIRTRRLAADASGARANAAAEQVTADLVRADWTASAQRMKGLERLRERHVAAVQRADDHAEARTVDDLVTRQYAVRSNNEEQ
jgi:flagellar FliJ protein